MRRSRAEIAVATTRGKRVVEALVLPRTGALSLPDGETAIIHRETGLILLWVVASRIRTAHLLHAQVDRLLEPVQPQIVNADLDPAARLEVMRDALRARVRRWVRDGDARVKNPELLEEA